MTAAGSCNQSKQNALKDAKISDKHLHMTAQKQRAFVKLLSLLVSCINK